MHHTSYFHMIKYSLLVMNAHGCIRWRGVMYVELFAIFEIGHIAVDQIYFEEFNSKKSASLAVRMHCAAHTRQRFLIS